MPRTLKLTFLGSHAFAKSLCNALSGDNMVRSKCIRLAKSSSKVMLIRRKTLRRSVSINGSCHGGPNWFLPSDHHTAPADCGAAFSNGVIVQLYQLFRIDNDDIPRSIGHVIRQQFIDFTVSTPMNKLCQGCYRQASKASRAA